MSDKIHNRIINETAQRRPRKRNRPEKEKKGRQAVELVTSSRFLDPGPETRLAILLYHFNKLVMRPARGSPLRQ